MQPNDHLCGFHLHYRSSRHALKHLGDSVEVTQKYHRVFCRGLGQPQSVASVGRLEPLPRMTLLNSNVTGMHMAWS